MSDDEDDFHREYERARRNDAKRTGPVRFTAPVKAPDWNAPPPTACPKCQGDLTAFGFCKPCRLKDDHAYSLELDDLCVRAVEIQRDWFAKGKPEQRSPEFAAWERDLRWLRTSGFLLTVQAIEERWAKGQKARRAREEDL